MTDALSARTMQILRYSEDEMLYLKYNYNELLQAFNQNLDLIKERDYELYYQDNEIYALRQLVKQQKTAVLLEDKLAFADAQLENYKQDHQRMSKQNQLYLKQIADLLQEKEYHIAEIYRLNILVTAAYTNLENTQAQLKQTNTYMLELNKEKTIRAADLSALRYDCDNAKQMREQLQDRAERLATTNESLYKQINGLTAQIFELKQDNQRLGLEYIKSKENSKYLEQYLQACKEDQEAFVKEVKRRHKDIKQSGKQLEAENLKLQQQIHTYYTEQESLTHYHAQKCYNYEQMLAQFERENINLRYKCQKLENEIRQIDLSYAGQINQRYADINVLAAEKDKMAQDCQMQAKYLLTELQAEKLKSAQLFAQLQDTKVDKAKADKSGEYQLIISYMRQDFEKAVQKATLLEKQLVYQQERVYYMYIELYTAKNAQYAARNQADELNMQLQRLKTEHESVRQYLLMKEADRLSYQDISILERLKSKLKEASQSLKVLSSYNEELERNCEIYKEKYMYALENYRVIVYYPPSVQNERALQPAVEYPPAFGELPTQAEQLDEFPSQLTFDNSLREGIYDILKRAGV